MKTVELIMVERYANRISFQRGVNARNAVFPVNDFRFVRNGNNVCKLRTYRDGDFVRNCLPFLLYQWCRERTGDDGDGRCAFLFRCTLCFSPGRIRAVYRGGGMFVFGRLGGGGDIRFQALYSGVGIQLYVRPF